MRLTRLLEDLDDKDTFEGSGYNCAYCDYQYRMGGLVDREFCNAHVAADRAIRDSEFRYGPAGEEGNRKRHEIFNAAMNKHGYIEQDSIEDPGHEIWVKKPLKEDLDDKDEFTRTCSTCANAERVMQLGAPQIDLNRFHADHIESARKASDEVSGIDQNNYYSNDMLYINLYHKEMNKHGWEWDAYESQWTFTESLDDTDKFERDCWFCHEQDVLISLTKGISAERPDIDEFHEVHSAARQAALMVGKYNTPEYKSEYEDVMNRHRYYYVPSSHGSYWAKE